MTHAGLLHHFKNKEELLWEVLDRWDEDTNQWFTSQREVRSFDDLIELIAAVVLRHRDEPALIQLLLSLGADASRPGHPAHERTRERYVTGRAFLVGYLRPLQARGEVDPAVDAEEMASTILAAMDGLQMQWLLDNEVDAARAVAGMLERYRPARA
jgi:AcrR family transcriptional regulator